MAEFAAASVLISTAPTTPAGLRALEFHLRDDRHLSVRHHIQIPVILDGRLRSTSNCETSSRGLAHRAARERDVGRGTSAPLGSRGYGVSHPVRVRGASGDCLTLT